MITQCSKPWHPCQDPWQDLGKDAMINHVLAKGSMVANPFFWEFSVLVVWPRWRFRYNLKDSEKGWLFVILYSVMAIQESQISNKSQSEQEPTCTWYMELTRIETQNRRRGETTIPKMCNDLRYSGNQIRWNQTLFAPLKFQLGHGQ